MAGAFQNSAFQTDAVSGGGVTFATTLTSPSTIASALVAVAVLVSATSSPSMVQTSPQTTYLAPSTYASVGGVSSVVGIRFGGCFIEAFE